MIAWIALMLPLVDDVRTIDLVQAYEEQRVFASGTEVKKVAGGLSIAFSVNEWPGIVVSTKSPQDWSDKDLFGIEVENPGTEAVAFLVRIDDAADSDGKKNCTYGTATIAAGKKQRFVLQMGKQPMDYGMRALPPIKGSISMTPNGQKIDLKQVHKWLVFLSSPKKPQSLILRDVRLEKTDSSLVAVVDQFGQYAKGSWPGKIGSEEELKRAHSEEKASIERSPALPDRDNYGGWTKGPSQKATGRFRTEKINGKWWFITPEGHLFWSTGVDCVNAGESTMITGREKAFTWLPTKQDPLGQFWGHLESVHSGPVKSGDTFDFRGANLVREFGADWLQLSLGNALARLRSWGFNTVGNWSDTKTWAFKKVPYVATVHLWGDHKTIMTGGDYWGPMHDVFDPRFKDSVAKRLGDISKTVIGDPWCLGWFVDNEISWAGSGEENGRFGIAYGALRAKADAPAKQGFLKQLKDKYADVASLNKAWGTAYESWQAMEAPLQFTEENAAKRKDDLIAFVKLFSMVYFKTIADELHRLDPGALYLGPRFAWFGRDSVEVCAEYADVVSFNIYNSTVDAKDWAWVNALNKPCIIGEFHFGSTDRGLFHPGLVSTENQKDRAAKFEAYVRGVVDQPAWVGCHWFQYADEPLLGRAFDGENYNIGLVNVVDSPYPEMIEAAKRVNGEIYARRSK